MRDSYGTYDGRLPEPPYSPISEADHVLEVAYNWLDRCGPKAAGEYLAQHRLAKLGE